MYFQPTQSKHLIEKLNAIQVWIDNVSQPREKKKC